MREYNIDRYGPWMCVCCWSGRLWKHSRVDDVQGPEWSVCCLNMSNLVIDKQGWWRRVSFCRDVVGSVRKNALFSIKNIVFQHLKDWDETKNFALRSFYWLAYKIFVLILVCTKKNTWIFCKLLWTIKNSEKISLLQFQKKHTTNKTRKKKRRMFNYQIQHCHVNLRTNRNTVEREIYTYICIHSTRGKD